MSPFARRTLILLTLALAGAAVGLTFAGPLVTALGHLLGLSMLVLNGPGDAAVVHLKLVVGLTAPPIAAWVGLLVLRVRGEEDPGLRVVLAFGALPWALALAAESARLAWTAWALQAMGTYEVEAMVGATEIAPGGRAALASVVSAGILVGVALWRTRDGRTREVSADDQ